MKRKDKEDGRGIGKKRKRKSAVVRIGRLYGISITISMHLERRIKVKGKKKNEK